MLRRLYFGITYLLFYSKFTSFIVSLLVSFFTVFHNFVVVVHASKSEMTFLLVTLESSCLLKTFVRHFKFAICEALLAYIHCNANNCVSNKFHFLIRFWPRDQ